MNVAFALALALSPAHAETAPHASTHRLSAAEALGAVLALTDAAVAAADVAQTRAKEPNAQAYAAQEKRWHSELRKEADRLAKLANVSPAASAASESLRERGAVYLKRLSAGPDFDASYLDTQSRLHVLADYLLERNAVRGEDYHIGLLLAQARGVIWKLSRPRASFAAEYPLLHRPDGDD